MAPTRLISGFSDPVPGAGNSWRYWQCLLIGSIRLPAGVEEGFIEIARAFCQEIFSTIAGPPPWLASVGDGSPTNDPYFCLGLKDFGKDEMTSLGVRAVGKHIDGIRLDV